MPDNRQKPNYRRTKEYRRLRDDLIANLESRGLVEAVYRDKVTEYLDLWVRRKQLQADIEARGITIWTEKGPAENRSVTLELQTSRQMLAIYNALGFREAPGSGRGAEPDDAL